MEGWLSFQECRTTLFQKRLKSRKCSALAARSESRGSGWAIFEHVNPWHYLSLMTYNTVPNGRPLYESRDLVLQVVEAKLV